MNSRRKFHPLTAVGLLALAAGGALRLFGPWNGDAAHTTIGFLYGVAIVLMLGGIYRTKHAKSRA